MKGMTKLAMGATLAVALSLAMLLALLLFLLVSLFCSLIRDRRQQHLHNLPQFRNDDNEAENQPPRPLTFPFYAHGVLKAPTKYLLSVPNLEAAAAKQPPSPSPSAPSCGHHRHHESSNSADRVVYISNPIYDGQQSTGDQFVTPMASPPGIEAEYDEAIDYNENVNENSPPLKLMKKLPVVLPKASSAAACLFDGRQSLGASTETNRPSSSSSSSSLCYSPSW